MAFTLFFFITGTAGTFFWEISEGNERRSERLKVWDLARAPTAVFEVFFFFSVHKWEFDHGEEMQCKRANKWRNVDFTRDGSSHTQNGEKRW